MSNYIFDNAGQQAGQRFTSLETLYDSWTIRHLEATGIDTGWQCWEIGGGGGSFSTWVFQRTRPPRLCLLPVILPPFCLVAGAPQPTTVVYRDSGARSPPLPRLAI